MTTELTSKQAFTVAERLSATDYLWGLYAPPSSSVKQSGDARATADAAERGAEQPEGTDQ